jgi:hypothetical protein
MSTATVRALVSIPTSQLRDDIRDAMIANGFTEQDLQRLEKQLAYRKTYNSRPEVKERRAEYTKQRNAKMKTLKQLLTNMPTE